MKSVKSVVGVFSILVALTAMLLEAGLRNKDVENDMPEARTSSSSEPSSSTPVEDELSAIGEELMSTKEAASSATETKVQTSNKRRAEAFIAGPDWEFDGFVSGGQDQDIKSMFATNDLVYLNIGSDQGLKPGERLGVYRRGNRVKDPQSGRMLGFEVRKLGVGEVTDRIDANTCSVRVISANEAVEIGDLVRKE